MKIFRFLIFIIILSCSDESSNDIDNTDPVNPIDLPPLEVSINELSVPFGGMTTSDISRTFYDVSGTFIYSNNDAVFAYFPGVAEWNPGQSGSALDVTPVSSQVLIKEDSIWNFHKTDHNLQAWGMRNFEILESKVVIGDGNEIGVNFSEWIGDAYIGQIMGNGDISWRQVNDPDEMGYFHGTGAGDLNNDGLTDVGLTPGIGHAGINIFLQNSDGSFTRNDEILNFEGMTPFTLDFSDLDGDGVDEIITADYGGGNITDEDDHEIRIYKFDNSTNKFELHFQINEPNAYDWGLGATSIKVYDFTNDGVMDIAVAREDLEYHGFEVWKGTGNAQFELIFSSPTWTQNEMQFREFSVFDANQDGNLDILLRPFHYGTLYRNSENCWWNVYACNGIKLNHLIWLNDGSGNFNYYNEEELIIEDLLVDSVHPYLYDGNLYFIGTFYNDIGDDIIQMIDIKVNF